MFSISFIKFWKNCWWNWLWRVTSSFEAFYSNDHHKVHICGHQKNFKCVDSSIVSDIIIKQAKRTVFHPFDAKWNSPVNWKSEITSNLFSVVAFELWVCRVSVKKLFCAMLRENLFWDFANGRKASKPTLEFSISFLRCDTFA